MRRAFFLPGGGGVDNLVLIRVAAALNADLRHAVLRTVVEEEGQRFRLGFEGAARRLGLVVSLDPSRPWIGRPSGRGTTLRRLRGPFAASCQRALEGRPLVELVKHRADRIVTLHFAGGQSLVAELVAHGANLLLLDREARVAALARSPRRSRGRLQVGEPYVPPTLPAAACNPFEADAESLDAFLDRQQGAGISRSDALRRQVFGVGPAVADLVLEESLTGGRTVGQVLIERLDALLRGALDPVIESPEEPGAAAESGRLNPESCRLLPWEPSMPPGPGIERFRDADPAVTAGLFHDALDRSRRFLERQAALQGITRRERQRVEAAAARARSDRNGMGDPDRHRRWAEALLAGLAQARWEDGAFRVPDPQRSEGPGLVVPARPGQNPQQAAEAHFRRHRRARRGLEQAGRRVDALRTRGERLDGLLARMEGPLDREGLETIERELRGLGVPVGLEPPTRAGRAARQARPRLEGVRVMTSRDGLEILVGRSGRDNHRLTFKLASPEDFWFHALGRSGAHVIVRNPQRRSRPPEATLREAAAVAAWYSEGQREELVDVQWTRRKYVRRPRSVAAGTVVVKRSETVRVEPGLPGPAGATELEPPGQTG